MNEYPGKFIVLDGIAGSGKTTLIRSAKETLKDQGYNIFDLKTWSIMNSDMPSYEDIESAHVIFTHEPTSLWIGKAIRAEMSQTEAPYSTEALAQAFALDRLILYRRIIIPALEAGKIIIQDRSVTSSINYQLIMDDAPSLDDLLNLSGNKLALEYPPDHLILTHADPETAIIRANKRVGISKGVFQQLPLLEKIHKRFREPWFEEIFTKRGTQIHTIDTDQTQEKSIEDFLTVLVQILGNPNK